MDFRNAVSLRNSPFVSFFSSILFLRLGMAKVILLFHTLMVMARRQRDFKRARANSSTLGPSARLQALDVPRPQKVARRAPERGRTVARFAHPVALLPADISTTRSR
jgi:hypothetical protein